MPRQMDGILSETKPRKESVQPQILQDPKRADPETNEAERPMCGKLSDQLRWKALARQTHQGSRGQNKAHEDTIHKNNVGKNRVQFFVCHLETYRPFFLTTNRTKTQFSRRHGKRKRRSARRFDLAPSIARKTAGTTTPRLNPECPVISWAQGFCGICSGKRNPTSLSKGTVPGDGEQARPSGSEKPKVSIMVAHLNKHGFLVLERHRAGFFSAFNSSSGPKTWAGLPPISI